MKVQFAHILQSLYRTTELDEVPVHRLQETLREHPYFSAVQFLLAQKLRSQQSEQYDEQVQKAAIYFHDPLWMHWQLSHGAETPVSIEQPLAAMHENNGNGYTEAQETTFAEQHPEPEIEIEQAVSESEEPEHETEQQPVSFVENLDEFQSPETDNNESGYVPVENKETGFHIDETPANVTGFQTNETNTQSAEADLHPDESESDQWPPVTESIHENGVEAIEPSVEAVEPAVETIEEPSSEIIRDGSEERHVEETTPVIQMTEATETPRSETASSPTAEKEPVAFDPYYTIDYFAYQGIKAPTEVEPGDKLGKQLKSFTEWLKTMRRLPQLPLEEQAEEPDETAQQDIRRFADDSLKDKQVVTETMAEVLVKQDRKEEAIRIYEKLSLLDPSKSAYFAAKIENLKSELI